MSTVPHPPISAHPAPAPAVSRRALTAPTHGDRLSLRFQGGPAQVHAGPPLSKPQKLLGRLLKPLMVKDFVVNTFPQTVVANLPPSLEGARLVHLSDMQFYAYTPPAYWDEVIEAINALEPDIVAITGDFIHQGPGYLQQAQDFLSRLSRENRQGQPVVRLACLGNHDYWDGSQGQAVPYGKSRRLSGAGERRRRRHPARWHPVDFRPG